MPGGASTWVGVGCGLWALAAGWCLAPRWPQAAAEALAPCPVAAQAALGLPASGGLWLLLGGPGSQGHEASLKRLLLALGRSQQRVVALGPWPQPLGLALGLPVAPAAPLQAQLAGLWPELPRPCFVRLGPAGRVQGRYPFLPGGWCGPGPHPSELALLRDLGTDARMALAP